MILYRSHVVLSGNEVLDWAFSFHRDRKAYIILVGKHLGKC
jgi:hypothetical protein